METVPCEEDGSKMNTEGRSKPGIYMDKFKAILLKPELRISEFQHFHWLTGHRLSVHIPAVPNMVKDPASAIKQADDIFAGLRKKL